MALRALLEQRLDALLILVRGTEIKLHELEQKTNLWEGREEGNHRQLVLYRL